MKFIDPHIHMNARTTNDYEAMAAAGIVAIVIRGAGRETHPELWRCVGPFADQSAITDLQHALASKNPLEREAAALALSECPIQEAQKILETVPELYLGIDAGRISWENIFRAMDKHALS